MKKTVITFGLISGAISSLLMVGGTMPLAEKIGFDKAEYLGYSILILSFLFGVFWDPLLPGHRGRRPDHLCQGVCGGRRNHSCLERLLRSELGAPVLQFQRSARFHRQICSVH